MCGALLKQPRAVYGACEAVAADLKRQHSSKRCVSVAKLCDVMAAFKVPGLQSKTGYSTLRSVRSVVFQEWPGSQQIFADTTEDWTKWRVMGGDSNVIRALGIWEFSEAQKLRDRVASAERRRIGVCKARGLGLYGFADLRCFICLAPESIACSASRRRKRFRGVDTRSSAAYRY